MENGDLLIADVARWIEPATVTPYFLDLAAPVLLDSSRSDGRLGRYSYFSAAPAMLLESTAGTLILKGGSAGAHPLPDADPWSAIARLLAPYRHVPCRGIPPFQGGALGYVGYEVGRAVGRLGPRRPRSGPVLPDLHLGFYDWVLARDHAVGRSWLIVHVLAAGGGAAARQRLAWLQERLPAAPCALPPPEPVASGPHGPVQSTFSRADYLDAVVRAKEYITAGDIYQVNLSQRLEMDSARTADPWHTYLRLRAGSPVPFGAYLGVDQETALLCGSPELFLHLDAQGHVETKPIKGTRPRGAGPAADHALAVDLQTSAKDRAENIMIVDLLRNDLGRVCRTGSVAVPLLWHVERYASVHQLVSTVTGRLRPEHDAVDLLRACFPGGSVTGCPKVRAMQIIDELEPSSRGPYCGTLGYIAYNGVMETNIVIRTVVMAHGRAYVQVGGAIVADSDPAAEYEETLVKARAALTALGHAAVVVQAAGSAAHG